MANDRYHSMRPWSGCARLSELRNKVLLQAMRLDAVAERYSVHTSGGFPPAKCVFMPNQRLRCLAILTDTYTPGSKAVCDCSDDLPASGAPRCGCTIDAHGFIDPMTGKIVKHLKKRLQKGCQFSAA